jgi:hypothetical protein
MKTIWIDKIKSTPPEVARIGTSFHKIASTWYDVVDWNELQKRKTFEDIRTYMRQCVSDVHPLMTPLVNNFLEYELNSYIDCRQKGKEFFFPLEKEFHVETNYFEGTIDALFKYTKLVNYVHEWKTGESFYVTDLRGELAFYCVLSNATQYRGTVKYISCFNANLNRRLFEKLHKASVNATQRWIERIYTSIRTNTWPKKISTACRNCPKFRECLLETVDIPYSQGVM